VTFSGSLSAADLARTSSVQPLDLEALAIVKGAQPYPAPPLEISDDQLKVVVELKFEDSAANHFCQHKRQHMREERQLRARVQGICRGY